MAHGAAPAPRRSASFLEFWGAAVVSVLAIALAASPGERRVRRAAGVLAAAAVGGVATVTGAWGLGHLGHGSDHGRFRPVDPARGGDGVAGPAVSHSWSPSWSPPDAKAPAPGCTTPILRFGRRRGPGRRAVRRERRVLAQRLVPSWEGPGGHAVRAHAAIKLVLVGLADPARGGDRAACPPSTRRPPASARVCSPRLTSVAGRGGARRRSVRRSAAGRPAVGADAWEAPTAGVHSASTDDLRDALAIAPNLPGAELHLRPRARHPTSVAGTGDRVLVDLGDGTLLPRAARAPSRPRRRCSDPGADEWIVSTVTSRLAGARRPRRRTPNRLGRLGRVVPVEGRAATRDRARWRALGGWWLAWRPRRCRWRGPRADRGRRRARREDSVVVELREEVGVATEVGADDS